MFFPDAIFPPCPAGRSHGATSNPSPRPSPSGTGRRASLLASEKGPNHAPQVISRRITLPHQPLPCTHEQSNIPRCMAAETDPCGLRACRLLAMKSFPDADRRFGRRCCCPCSGLQMEMKQPQRVTQQRRRTERRIASASSVSSSFPLHPSGTGAGDSADAHCTVLAASSLYHGRHLLPMDRIIWP